MPVDSFLNLRVDRCWLLGAGPLQLIYKVSRVPLFRSSVPGEMWITTVE